MPSFLPKKIILNQICRRHCSALKKYFKRRWRCSGILDSSISTEHIPGQYHVPGVKTPSSVSPASGSALVPVFTSWENMTSVYTFTGGTAHITCSVDMRGATRVM